MAMLLRLLSSHGCHYGIAALLGTLLLLSGCQQGPGTPPVREDDHGDSPSTATQLVAGQLPSTKNPAVAANADHAPSIEFSTEGTLTAGDLDYFVITVTQAGTLTASTSGSTDTYGYLEARTDHRHRTVLDEDDNSGGGENFRVTAQVTPGIYYIGVMGSSITTTGYYELWVTFGETPPTGPPETDTERLMGVWKTAFYGEDGRLYFRTVLSFTETRYTEHFTNFDENDGSADGRWTGSGGWKVTGPSEIVFSYEYDGEIRTRLPGGFLWQDDYQTLILRWDQAPFYTVFTRDDSPPVDLEGVWRRHGRLKNEDTVREVITFTPTHITYVEVRTIDGTDHDLVTTGTWAAGPDNMLLWTIEDSDYTGVEPGDELRLAYAPTGSADRIVVSDFGDEMDYRDGEWVPNGFFGRYRMELVRE